MVTKTLKMLAEVYRLVRLPNLVVMVLFQALLQYVLIGPHLAQAGIDYQLPLRPFVLLVAATVCIAAGGNVINDYFDIQTDRINRPQRVVVGSSIDRRYALLLHVTLTLIGIFAGLYLAFLLRRPGYMAVFVVIPVLLWFYSTHFKKQVMVGNMLVALLVALTGYMVVSVDYTLIDRFVGRGVVDTEPLSNLWQIVMGYCFFAFVANMAREIIKDMEDAHGDEATGCRTLAVELGPGLTKVVVLALQAFLLFMIGWSYSEWDELRASPLGLPYVVGALVLPTLWLCLMVLRARNKKDLKRASWLSKIIMLLGVLTMVII